MKHTIFFFLLFSFTSISAQTIVGFDNPVPSAPANCNINWTESGIPQIIIPIPPGTNCGFDYSNSDLWLFSGRLVLDLSSLSDITSIEIDLIDWCDISCTNADFLVAGNSVGTAANTTTGTMETIVYNNTAMDAIDEMTIESFENQMMEIRIFTATSCDTPANPDVWVDQGDVYLENECNGVILTSPDGTCYRIKVENGGTLVSEEVSCP